MTPLRQRFIEDMQLRGLAPTTQRSYTHYVADFAKFYNTSPEKLDLEAIRQYEERHPELRRATYRVPHMGYPGTAANYVMHLAKTGRIGRA